MKTHMARSARILLMASGIVAVGCTSVFTIDDVVTETAAIRDDRLLGEWKETGGSDRARVVRGQRNDYSVSFIDKEDSVQFRARLGRLGSTLVLDAFPDSALWNARKESGVPTHTVLAVEFRGDSIGLRGLKGDSVKTLLASGRLRVPYTQNFGDVVLHGDPVAVRAAMADIFQRRLFVEEVVWYRRSRL
jgi:hypothetical protein